MVIKQRGDEFLGKDKNNLRTNNTAQNGLLKDHDSGNPAGTGCTHNNRLVVAGMKKSDPSARDKPILTITGVCLPLNTLLWTGRLDSLVLPQRQVTNNVGSWKLGSEAFSEGSRTYLFDEEELANSKRLRHFRLQADFNHRRRLDLKLSICTPSFIVISRVHVAQGWDRLASATYSF